MTVWTNHATPGTAYSQTPVNDTTPEKKASTLTINPLNTVSGKAADESEKAAPPEKKAATVTPIERQTPTWQIRYRATEEPGFQFGKYFYINMPKTMVELQYEFRDVTGKSNNSETTAQYSKFSETIGFSTDGWIYHPALLTYEIAFEPQFVQAYGENTATFGNNTTSTTDSSTYFSPDYLFRLAVLESKPYTVHLFANQREIPSWNVYQGGITTTMQDYGGDFDLNRYNIPVLGHVYSNLAYTSLDSEVSGFNNYEYTEDQFRFESGQRGYQLKTALLANYSEHTQISDFFVFSPTDSASSVETHTERLGISHTHQLQLLENQRSMLNGTWNYLQSTFDNPATTLDFEHLRLAEQLYWRHTDNLTTYLDLIYQNIKQSEDRGSDSYNSRIRLQHLLYENLTTETGLSATYYDHNSGLREYLINPFLNFQYYRPVPWGSVSLQTGWNYLLSERSYDESQTQTLSALNEGHTLQYGQDTFLNNYNVIIESIIVTNTAGTIQYVRDIDYQVEQFNESVSIRPTLFGNINDGQAVDVNYSYRPDLDYSDDMFTQNYSVATTIFNSWHLSLSHSRADQNVNTGTPPMVLSNSTSTQGRIRYNIHWSDTTFEANQVDNDAIGTSQQWYISQKFYYRLNNTFDIAVLGSYSETYYDENEISDRKQYGGTLQTNWRIAQGLTFRTEGYTTTYENAEDKTINTGVRAGLVYSYRLWSATLLYDIVNHEFERLGNNNSRLEHLIKFDIIRIKF